MTSVGVSATRLELQITERKMTTKKPSRRKRPDVVQVKNPKSGHYVKIDRSAGKIISHKKTAGPYKGVRVVRKSR